MRILFLLAAAALALQTSGVQAQQQCSQSYVACMDKCVARPSQSLQATCMEACQSGNRACSAKIYGNPPTSEMAAQPQQQQPQGDQPQAAATDEDAKPAKPAAQAKSGANSKPAAGPAKRQVAAPARQERRPQ